MRAWHFSETAYPYLPPADSYPSIRVSLPNRIYDPAKDTGSTNEGNTFWTDQMYVQYQIPVDPRKYPLVLVHGGGGTGRSARRAAQSRWRAPRANSGASLDPRCAADPGGARMAR